ncbi:MAG: diguanylate cyclase [Myxococcales bacterium]|nr:diguanylate cyclase [Myxococcales bacterium]MCB9523569.1 diguanylate cyclase [Myxococcales bacterium]
MAARTYQTLSPSDPLPPDHPGLLADPQRLIELVPGAAFAIRPLPDGDWELAGLNRRHADMTGLQAFVGVPISTWAPPELLADLSTNYGHAAAERAQITYVETLHLPSGSEIWRTHLLPLFDDSGACRLLIGTGFPVGEQIAAEHRAQALTEALRRQAMTDELTGLPNRRAFTEQLVGRQARARRRPHPFFVALLDVDALKAINDNGGHAAGDGVLREVGRALAAEIRAEDFVARLGGDEFALLLEGDDPQTPERFHARVMAALAQAALCCPVTLSMGFTMARADDYGVDAPLRRADRALYQAKDHARGQVVGQDTPVDTDEAFKSVYASPPPED